jgi:hypothetical protein
MEVHFEVSRKKKKKKKKKKKNRIMNLGGEMIGIINLVTK